MDLKKYLENIHNPNELFKIKSIMF
jgi:hypothetical protein